MRNPGKIIKHLFCWGRPREDNKMNTVAPKVWRAQEMGGLSELISLQPGKVKEKYWKNKRSVSNKLKTLDK